MDRVFNWAPNFDERSRAYPLRAVASTINTHKRNKLWKTGPILDQGSEGACVGFGWAGDALANPVGVKLDRVSPEVPREPDAFARTIYWRARQIDEWDGEDYEGTSVLAGAKTMKELGMLKEYRWAFGVNDVIDGVLGRGPVVLGTYWYDSMYDPQNGLLKPEGEIVGGHCYLAVGFRYKSGLLNGADGVVVQNSWGSDWGNGGLAVISVEDLDKLLRQDGEACVPWRRSYAYHKA